ncbi:MAG: Spy/CpxP family protein refolding chaperone [Rhodospirillales bacterium]
MAIAALAASMLSAPGVVAAQPVGHMGGGGHHFELTEILHGLNLTDAQKQQAHLAEQAAWARAKPVLEQMHALHEQIATQFLTAGTTAAQLAPLVRQEEQLRSKLDSEHLTVALQIRNLLTADQLAKAATLHAQLSALHQQERDVLQGAHDGAN